jgi:hypothetical protein
MSSDDADIPTDDIDIPNFLMLDQIPANYTQQLETDLLEPVVFSQGAANTDGFCRFTLQNKGFLHSHSKIFVALKPAAGQTNVFLQPHVGIGQIVKKAVLKIGNKTLNEIDSWASLHAVKSSLITNENNREREMYMTGRFMNHDFIYNDDSKVFANSYGLDNGVEYSSTGSSLEQPSWAIMDGTKPDECPSYSIDLSDLFPFLKVNQLPLYLIKEPINIELTFEPTTKRRVQITNGISADLACEIVRDELKFCADYIFYGSSDEMDRFAMGRGRDMNFSFVDYRLVEHTTSPTQLGSTVIRNLGMANRMVPRIITLLAADDQDEDTIFGKNNSMAPFVSADGVSGGVKYNVRYNDRFEFTSDVDNIARLFSIFQQSEGVPFITRQEFSDCGSVAGAITTRTFQGRDQSATMSGHMFYLATRLTNGRVGQRGIEVHVSGDFPDSGRVLNLMRCFCEYIRVGRLSNGFFEIYNA